MATIDLATRSGQQAISQFGGGVQTAYLVEAELDFEAAIAAKGGALAAADVIEVIDIPAGTLITAAGFEVVAEHAGTSTDAALDLGITGGDVDAFVDGFDLDAASVGDFSAIAAGTASPTLVTTADTIDVLIAAMTGTTTAGKLRVWAALLDVSNHRKAPGRAALGS